MKEFHLNLILLSLIIWFILLSCVPVIKKEGIDEGISSEQRALLNLADSDFKNRKWEDAILKYKKIIKLYPNTESANYSLWRISYAYIYLNDYPEAEKNAKLLFTSAVNNDMKSLSFHILAKIKNIEGKDKEALLYYIDGLNLSISSSIKEVFYNEMNPLLEKIPAQEIIKWIDEKPYSKSAPEIIYKTILIKNKINAQSDVDELYQYLALKYPASEELEWANTLLFPEKAKEKPKVEKKTKREEKLLIGLLFPQSGEFSLFGKEALNGAIIALNEYFDSFGKNIDYEIRDTEGDAITTLKIIQELSEKPNLVGVIGPMVSMPTIAAAGYLSCKKIPLISPTASEKRIQDISPFIFQLNIQNVDPVEELAKFLLSIGYKNFAIIYPLTHSQEEKTKKFAKSIVEGGGKIVAIESFSPDSSDFQKELERIKETNPEVLFAPVDDEKAIMIATQTAFVEMNVRLAGDEGWFTERLIALGEHYVDSAYIVSLSEDESGDVDYSNFLNLYYSTFNKKTTRIGYLGYLATKLLLTAISSGAETPSEVQQNLVALKNNPEGRKFFEFGQSPSIFQVLNRRFVKIK